MPAYASVGGVQGRVANRTISATSSPSTTTVGEWIDQAEARLDATLARAGITLDPARVSVVVPFLLDEVSGQVREAYAALGGDGNNDDGVALRERFDAFLAAIVADPAGWSAALGTPATAASTRSQLASYATDNRAGLSLDGGDFEPEFRRGWKG